MDRIPINKYPYTDYHEINLDWVIERIQEMYTIIDQKIAAAIAPINTQIIHINTDLNSIHTDISNLSVRMTNAEGNISTLNNTITVINGRIDGVMGDVNELSETVENIEIDIDFLRNEIGIHTEEIADIYNKISEIDPDTGLIVNANNFNRENKTASILDTTYKFELTGGTQWDDYNLWPDTIPGGGYFPRVTMDTDAVTGKIKLPSELTTGTLPAILRGTYATNVDKNAEPYTGTALEYRIDGSDFIIDGYDSDAIILMCIACLHRGVNDYENQIHRGGSLVDVGIPTVDSNYKYTGTTYFKLEPPHIEGLIPYLYFFDISGNLLGYEECVIAADPVTIPAGTYSIWYGIGTGSQHTAWHAYEFAIELQGSAGSYYVSSDTFITKHEVDFTADGGEQYSTAQTVGIKGLADGCYINMKNGEVRDAGSHVIDTFTSVYNAISHLSPDEKYTVTLARKDTGYVDADLYYNKIMVILDGLDANNVRY